MSETKKTTAHELNEVHAIKQAKDFWGRFSKPIMYIGGLVILLAGGYLLYKNFFIGPKETKGNEAISRAQQYFAQDSLDLALNGDGSAAGFLKIAKTYSGTKAANLAHYYAGAIYLRKEDYNNAIKQLEDFSTDATQVQSAAWRMLAKQQLRRWPGRYSGQGSSAGGQQRRALRRDVLRCSGNWHGSCDHCLRQRCDSRTALLEECHESNQIPDDTEPGLGCRIVLRTASAARVEVQDQATGTRRSG